MEEQRCPVCGTMAYKSGFCINHYQEYKSMYELEAKAQDLFYFLQYLAKALELGLYELRMKDSISDREDFHWWKREQGDDYHKEGIDT